MSLLEEKIKESIRKSGSISVAVFMEKAASHYYATRDPFGTAGDFTTAPEISQMFGEMLGLWAADCWLRMGKPTPFILMECGPGRGTLMADTLRATKNIHGFHEAAQIILLENSPILQRIQQQTMKDWPIEWIDTFDALSTREFHPPLILLANEFLDALPIRQFQYSDKRWQERFISLDEKNNLFFHLAPFTDIPDLPSNAKEGEIAELSPARTTFAENVCEYLKNHGGCSLFIDYGYVQGYGDTLQAMKNHSYSDILSHAGEADITAHVDFAALSRAARECAVSGPITQESFLRSLGIETRAMHLKQKATQKQTADINAALQRLISPDQMGTLFKVIAFSNTPFLPAGFPV